MVYRSIEVKNFLFCSYILFFIFGFKLFVINWWLEFDFFFRDFFFCEVINLKKKEVGRKEL